MSETRWPAHVDVPDAMKCEICCDALKAVVVCDNGHRTCVRCAKTIVEKCPSPSCPDCRQPLLRRSDGTFVPDRTAAEMHDLWVIACPNAGCEAVITVGEFDTHLAACPHAMVSCCLPSVLMCPWRGKRMDLAAHAASDHSSLVPGMLAKHVSDTRAREQDVDSVMRVQALGVGELAGCVRELRAEVVAATTTLRDAIATLGERVATLGERAATKRPLTADCASQRTLRRDQSLLRARTLELQTERDHVARLRQRLDEANGTIRRLTDRGNPPGSSPSSPPGSPDALGDPRGSSVGDGRGSPVGDPRGSPVDSYLSGLSEPWGSPPGSSGGAANSDVTARDIVHARINALNRQTARDATAAAASDENDDDLESDALCVGHVLSSDDEPPMRRVPRQRRRLVSRETRTPTPTS